MFGIGAQEIVIIMVIALIIFGPQRLPEIAGQVAKAIRDFRRMSDDLTGEFQRSLTLDDDKKPDPILTNEVIAASATPDQISSSIAQSLRVETIPDEVIAPTPTTGDETNGLAVPTTDTSGEDTVINLAPAATKAEPLSGVSALDGTAPYVGETYPAKPAPHPLDFVYEPTPMPTTGPIALDAEPATTGEADAVRAQGGVADAWDAVISTDVTASSAALEAPRSEEAPVQLAGSLAYTPPSREPIDPQAEPTIREQIESQVAAEAFRERRRSANYQRMRRRDQPTGR